MIRALKTLMDDSSISGQIFNVGNDERLSLTNLKSGTRLIYEIVSRLAGGSSAAA